MKIFRKLHALFHRRRLDAGMTEEMQTHLELQTRANIECGMSPSEARYAAQRQFGGLEQTKERCRDQRTFVWAEQMVQDVRFAARSLRKNPGFAIIALLTLALGIGANTTLFSVANALLLRNLPVVDPARLVQMRTSRGENFSYPTYKRFRDQAHGLAGIALTQRTVDKRALVATGLGSTAVESVKTHAVSGNYFDVLGVSAALGRALNADDDRAAAAEPVTVLSHAYWISRFGGDPTVLGKTLQVDGVILTIVGVMPPGFSGFEISAHPDLWWPVELLPRFNANPKAPNLLVSEGSVWALIIGRLKSDGSREQAAAELQTIFQRERAERAAQSTWTENERRDFLALTLELQPAANGFTPFRKQLSQPLGIVAVIVGLALLIACANLAGLLLARGVARKREFAVRAALGAGRARLMRQLVTESLLLSLLGGTAGILIARAGITFLRQYLVSQMGALDVNVDGRMLVFAISVSAITGLLVGLVPALQLSRETLHVTEKSSAGTRSRLNQSLVVAQVAVCVVLLAGAGLFVRSLQKLKSADLGFQTENRVRFALEFTHGYSQVQRAAVYKRVLAGLESLPQVRSATVSGAGLLSGDESTMSVNVEGYVPAAREDIYALVVVAGPRFFETLGIPLLAGRGFAAGDEPAGSSRPRIAVVGESFAKHFFGTTSPLGRKVKLGEGANPPVEIVGVAKDVKYRTPRDRPEMQLYVPYFGGVTNMPMTLTVAAQGDARALAPAIRSLVREADKGVLVSNLHSMDAVVDATLVQERLVAQLAGFFSLFALTLASLGLYGVLSYRVVQRTREIGVRLALGALPRDVLASVVREGMSLSLIGAAVGLAVALATTHFAAKLLYGVTPGDPATLAGAGALLLFVSLAACSLPARRAARVDPMIALRTE